MGSKYNLFQNTRYLIDLAWKLKRSVLLICLLSASIAVLTSLIGLFIAPVILSLIETAAPINSLIITILLFAGLLMVVHAASAYIDTIKRDGWQYLFVRIVIMSSEKYMKTALQNTENMEYNKMMDRAKKANMDLIFDSIWLVYSDLIKNIAGFIIYAIMLTAVNPIILAVVVAFTLAGFYINNYINGWGYRHRDEEAEYSRRMNYMSDKTSNYTLAKDIRIFVMGGWIEDMYKSVFRLYSSFIVRGEKVYIWANVVDVIIIFLRNGIAYIFLFNMVLNNGLSASEFLLYFMAVGGLAAWVSSIFSGFSKLYKQSLDISVLREALEYPEPFAFEEGESLIPNKDMPYKIELKNVSFKYKGAESDTLKNINLTIQPGEKLAIIGLNGAGKTTLVKLICGFYEPTAGEVLLNGENIQKYNRRDYYRHFSAVFQDFPILPESISINIAQTDRNIDMEYVAECAEKAGLTKKINSLPNRFNTRLGKEIYEDGIELSGGEKQRLMLARALYKNAPIIVLDEPTAALDPIAESDMYNKYATFTGGRTSLYISHRLASTRFCDRIILLEHGNITEEGNHVELIKKKGKYAELFEMQSRYYREGGAEYANKNKPAGI